MERKDSVPAVSQPACVHLYVSNTQSEDGVSLRTTRRGGGTGAESGIRKTLKKE